MPESSCSGLQIPDKILGNMEMSINFPPPPLSNVVKNKNSHCLSCNNFKGEKGVSISWHSWWVTSFLLIEVFQVLLSGIVALLYTVTVRVNCWTAKPIWLAISVASMLVISTKPLEKKIRVFKICLGYINSILCKCIFYREKFPDERIPCLEEVVDLCVSHGLQMYIDVKAKTQAGRVSY